VDDNRAALGETFRELSEELAALLSGLVPPELDPALPPPDSGVLDEVTDPA
jgi:hypothetical protein